ncbi:MAG TPA: MFS transporter [Rhizomicrobium sp.]|jgi:MFS family permease|nr:MFS transporter [Rhizomicrobium sp.]
MGSQLYSIAAILVSTAFLLAGNGLMATLTPLRANLEGFSHLAIGAMGSFYYAGFVAGCLAGPRVLARVGHIRAFAVAAALTAATVLLQSLLVAPVAWFLIRAAFGFCAANVFMALESWLNERATNQTRGRVLAAYVIVNLTFLTLGQWLLLLASPSGFKLFSVAAIAYICCLVPVGLTQQPQPAPQPVPPLRVRRLMRMAPVGVAGVITVGLANGAFWTLAPVYAQTLGFRTSGVAAFMSAFIVGGALIQIPLARFSDRLDRRWLMALACASAVIFGVALAMLGRLGIKTPALLFPAAFVFGAAMLPLYSLSIAHANDRMLRSEFVEASATLLLINALASVIGPLLAAVITAHAGMPSLFLYTAAVHLAMTVFTVVRTFSMRAVAGTAREHYVAVPQQASPGAIELDPRGREHNAREAA